VWFSATDTDVISVFGSNHVGTWNFVSAERKSGFQLRDNTSIYPDGVLSVSGSSRVVIAAVKDEPIWISEKSFSVGEIYDTASGKLTEVKVELTGAGTCGFIESTPTLVLAARPPNNAVVAAVDVITGKNLWRSETDDDVQTGTIALNKGLCYVNFCRDGRLRARNQSGKLIWERPVGDGKFAEPGFWPKNPNLPYVVVAESRANEGTDRELIALSGKNGSVIWRTRNPEIESLKAISNDGARQVFFRNGRVEISELPKEKITRIDSLSMNMDVVFSPNGRFLLCLPALTKVSEDKGKNTYTVARSSGLLTVVDAETGNVVRKFPLIGSQN
jgi:outer membrane protein assembly factor BamB